MTTFADRIGHPNNFNLLRMLAAAGVLVSHAYALSLGPDTPEPFETVLKGDNLGRACVFVFFAISGFFISASYVNQGNALNFVRARALRILPGLYVMLLFSVILGFAVKVGATDAAFWAAVPGYLGSQGLLEFPSLLAGATAVSSLPGVFDSNPLPQTINGSLWSLPLEVTCYLGVMVCGMFGLLQRRGLFAAVLLIATAGAVFRAIALSRGWNLPFLPQILVYVGFPFVIGMAFYVWADRVPMSWKLACGLVFLAIASWPTPLFQPVFVVALSYTTFVIGFSDLAPIKGYNRLGDYSYGMYIYAFPVQQTLAQLGVKAPLGNMALAFPAVLMLSVLSWHLVEKPFLRLKARRSQAAHGTMAGATSPGA